MLNCPFIRILEGRKAIPTSARVRGLAWHRSLTALQVKHMGREPPALGRALPLHTGKGLAHVSVQPSQLHTQQGCTGLLMSGRAHLSFLSPSHQREKEHEL
ncbi:rCG28534 [Rattus norvegicus]|uniref:RCG28534 n=1 Tax=Rattus norvegicus TaxID=10116 RepID=A6HUZ6_RAT|nr:rCG28534 [Rattus norvegicus]